MSKYWSQIVRELEPYVPGEQPKDQRYIKLNTNENPYPPSPRVIEAIKAATDSSLRRYPDPNCDDLKQAIADYHNLDHNQVFVGNGSDEILALAFICFFKQQEPILFPDITYSFYIVYCRFFEIACNRLPLTDDFDISLDDYERPNGGIIFANPNAPTGKLIPLEKIEALLKQNRNSVVIVDEAYIDFGGESAVALIGRFPNLLVIHTLSKSRSLAGMRVGAAMGPVALIEGLERAKNSFNSYPLDRLALVGAVEALKDTEYFRSTCEKVIQTREWTATELAKLNFEVVPSKANFVFVKHPQIAAETLFRQLKAQNILVRFFNKPRINEFLRVTIGTDEDMQTFVQTLSKIVN